MEAYAIISIQTASPALDFQCLVFLTDELKTQLLPPGGGFQLDMALYYA